MHPQNKEQASALKAIAKALKIEVTTGGLTEHEKAISRYGKEIVESIERGEKDIKAGRVTRISDVNNIWESIL